MNFHYYWEDFPVGRVFEYGSRQLSEQEIIDFARDWDPQRFHTDPVAAKETPFGGLVASGWHTGSVLMRFMCDAYLNESSCIGSPGIEEWRFALPVRPGDTLHYRGTVIESRPSASKPDRGIVKWRWELLNQRGEVAVLLIGTQFFLRRP
ncbi:MAG: MaoC family dehydratase [Betaproteobacteria bacterium]|nr:MaoC family dehydratase [Betaproteobacteria bacterium]MBV9361279.1 MaoC family dehydratase [Betaproteobacteria bacterium]